MSDLDPALTSALKEFIQTPDKNHQKIFYQAWLKNSVFVLTGQTPSEDTDSSATFLAFQPDQEVIFPVYTEELRAKLALSDSSFHPQLIQGEEVSKLVSGQGWSALVVNPGSPEQLIIPKGEHTLLAKKNIPGVGDNPSCMPDEVAPAKSLINLSNASIIAGLNPITVGTTRIRLPEAKPEWLNRDYLKPITAKKISESAPKQNETPSLDTKASLAPTIPETLNTPQDSLAPQTEKAPQELPNESLVTVMTDILKNGATDENISEFSDLIQHCDFLIPAQDPAPGDPPDKYRYFSLPMQGKKNALTLFTDQAALLRWKKEGHFTVKMKWHEIEGFFLNPSNPFCSVVINYNKDAGCLSVSEQEIRKGKITDPDLVHLLGGSFSLVGKPRRRNESENNKKAETGKSVGPKTKTSGLPIFIGILVIAAILGGIMMWMKSGKKPSSEPSPAPSAAVEMLKPDLVSEIPSPSSPPPPPPPPAPEKSNLDLNQFYKSSAPAQAAKPCQKTGIKIIGDQVREVCLD